MFDAVIVGMTPEEALASLRPDMIDADAARSWVLRRVSPGGPMCPECGDVAVGVLAMSWWADRRVKCKGCGRFFCNRSGSPFEGCALGWRELYVMLVMLAAGCTAEEIGARLGVHGRTIVRMQQRLMVAP